MPYAWLIGLAVVVVLPLGYLLLKRRYSRRMRHMLQAQWGTRDALRRPDADQQRDIARYWQAQQEHSPFEGAVDNTTWNDLDMDQLLASLDCSHSIVGSEVLYAMLRRQDAPLSVLERREALSVQLCAQEDTRLTLQMILSGLGYHAFHGATRYLFHPQYQMPQQPWRFRVLAVLPFTLVMLGFLWNGFFIAAILALMVNMFVHYRTQAVWEKEMTAIRHLALVLHGARKLARAELPGLEAEQQEIRGIVSQLRSIRLWLQLFGSEQIHDLDMITPLLKVTFMLDMLSFVSIIKGLQRHGPDMRRLYELVGELDAVLSIAQLRARHGALARPVFHEELRVEARGLCHPLVERPVPNDLLWNRNMLITGSNASGKSTFIKAVAINAVLAQTLYVCFADSMALCRARVMTSMAIRDSVLAGESYFIAELRSLHRIVDARAQGQPILCFVDEILRGTNTIERIAASSAVLRALAGGNLLCMTATHDIELTRILDGLYQNVHFSEVVDEHGVRFDYLLREGPTRTRNAILLLDQMGYDSALIAEARDNVRRFEMTGRWQAE
ncbi:MAG: hypothetical protein GX650_00050 [Clostridiales bacterium]|nr:hypothetical protein [Clostridiales bacterium]